MARLVDQAVTRLAWVATVSNPSAPTAAELTAGINFTPVMTTSYDFGADDSDKVSEQGVQDTAKTEAPTMINYHLTIVAFRSYTAGVTAADDLMATLAGNLEQGYFYRRLGLASTAAFATGQKLDVGLFTMDTPQIAGGVASGFLKITVKGLVQGFYKPVVTVA